MWEIRVHSLTSGGWPSNGKGGVLTGQIRKWASEGRNLQRFEGSLVTPAFHSLVEPSTKGIGEGMTLAVWSWLSGDPDFAGRWVLKKMWWDTKEVHPIYCDSFQIKGKLETQVSALLKWNMKFIFQLLWPPQTPSNCYWLGWMLHIPF